MGLVGSAFGSLIPSRLRELVARPNGPRAVVSIAVGIGVIAVLVSPGPFIASQFYRDVDVTDLLATLPPNAFVSVYALDVDFSLLVGAQVCVGLALVLSGSFFLSGRSWARGLLEITSWLGATTLVVALLWYILVVFRTDVLAASNGVSDASLASLERSVWMYRVTFGWVLAGAVVLFGLLIWALRQPTSITRR